MTESDIEVVNLLATGELGTELDFEALSKDLRDVNYSPGDFVGLVYKPSIPGTLVLYRSGKYTISGISNESELIDVECKLIGNLNDLGISDIPKNNAKINNIVCTGDLERDIDLSKLSTFLGVEDTEYEPEQNPFLVYRPNTSGCVLTIASSGKIVITGIKERTEADQVFSQFRQKLDSFPV